MSGNVCGDWELVLCSNDGLYTTNSLPRAPRHDGELQPNLTKKTLLIPEDDPRNVSYALYSLPLWLWWRWSSKTALEKALLVADTLESQSGLFYVT